VEAFVAEVEVEAFVVEVEVEASLLEVEMDRRSCDGGGGAACAAYDCWNHLHCDAWQSWEEVGEAWAKVLRHRDAWQSGEEEMVGILRHRHRHRLRPGKQTHS